MKSRTKSRRWIYDFVIKAWENSFIGRMKEKCRLNNIYSSLIRKCSKLKTIRFLLNQSEYKRFSTLIMFSFSKSKNSLISIYLTASDRQNYVGDPPGDRAPGGKKEKGRGSFPRKVPCIYASNRIGNFPPSGRRTHHIFPYVIYEPYCDIWS